jgi:hypothetical protein
MVGHVHLPPAKIRVSGQGISDWSPPASSVKRASDLNRFEQRGQRIYRSLTRLIGVFGQFAAHLQVCAEYKERPLPRTSVHYVCLLNRFEARCRAYIQEIPIAYLMYTTNVPRVHLRYQYAPCWYLGRLFYPGPPYRFWHLTTGTDCLGKQPGRTTRRRAVPSSLRQPVRVWY